MFIKFGKKKDGKNEISENQKIESLKTQIASDLSAKVAGEMMLPYAFTEFEKTDKKMGKVSVPVMVLDGKVYPVSLFWSYANHSECMVAFLSSGFEALGNQYETLGGEKVYGIPFERTRGDMLENYLRLMHFELDLDNNSYREFDGTAKKEEIKQRGE